MVMSCSKPEKLNKLWVKYCLGQGNLERNSLYHSNLVPSTNNSLHLGVSKILGAACALPLPPSHNTRATALSDRKKHKPFKSNS